MTRYFSIQTFLIGLSNEQEQMLIEKVRTLSSDKISQVLDFVDFLSQKDKERRLIKALLKKGQHSLSVQTTTIDFAPI